MLYRLERLMKRCATVQAHLESYLEAEVRLSVLSNQLGIKV